MFLLRAQTSCIPFMSPLNKGYMSSLSNAGQAELKSTSPHTSPLCFTTNCLCSRLKIEKNPHPLQRDGPQIQRGKFQYTLWKRLRQTSGQMKLKSRQIFEQERVRSCIIAMCPSPSRHQTSAFHLD